jgi:hypothetical protein
VTAMIMPHITGVRNGDKIRKHQPKMKMSNPTLMSTSTDLVTYVVLLSL